MTNSAHDMIAAIDAFVAKDDGSDESSLGDVLEGFDKLPDRRQILPAMFAVMGRYPEADLGSPGPLVHSIETLPVPDFEPLLRASVQKQPGQLNVWMLNRILNSRLPPQHREELLHLLQAVRIHPRASSTTRDTAARFLAFQAERKAR